MNLVAMLIRFGFVIGVLLLSACQSQPPSGASPVYDAGIEANEVPAPPGTELPADRFPPSAEPAGEPDESISAVSALEAEAWNYIREGQWLKAIAAAEHGLRINRRYAPFYQVLAEGYRSLGNVYQATQFARQARRFCGDHCSEIDALLMTLGPPD